MKKIILSIFTVISFGCGYAPMDNSQLITITRIEKNDKIYCYYYGDGASHIVSTLTESYFMFRDTCGKFQIGDTINFVKIK